MKDGLDAYGNPVGLPWTPEREAEALSGKSQTTGSVPSSKLETLAGMWESKASTGDLSDFDRGVNRGLEIAAMSLRRLGKEQNV